MYNPTTRLLTVLELLQSRGSITGPELAEKLEVEVRSVRRYITMLRDMGIPVDSEPGRYGSYNLRPGFRMPPLMFNNTEIVTIVLGLMAVKQLGLAAALGVESASAKIERVLPDELRERVHALQCVLTLQLPGSKLVPEQIIACVSIASYQCVQCWIEYHGSRNDTTERAVDIYGVVYRVGFWYAVGFCHLRSEIRIFRLDRIRQIRLLDTPFIPPAHFDALEYVVNTLANMPGMWSVEVFLKLTLEEAQARVPADMATLEAVDDGVILRCYMDSFDWFTRFLVGLRCRVMVIHPPELRDALRALAQAITEMAEQS